MDSYLTMMHEIHILVVDYDSEMPTLLETCQYRVTHVELASTGIRLLLSEKTKFDLVIADINSVDCQAFGLLKEAVSRNIPTILMSVEDNISMAMRALENGAFLHIKKPASVEVVKYLWQHVIRETARTRSEGDRIMPNNHNDDGAFNMFMLKDKVGPSGNIGTRKGANREEEALDSDRQGMEGNKSKTKMSVQWTQELHDKFMEAVEQLGEGKCFPKGILELMNVPGLTKMQVASHLQRCRDNKWPPAKAQRRQLGIQPRVSNSNLAEPIPRTYGTMPQLSSAPSHDVGIQDTIGAEIEMHNHATIENMAIKPMDTDTSRYGLLAPFPGNAALSSSIPVNLSDDLLSFPEMDNTMESFFELPHGLASMPNLDFNYGDNHFDGVPPEQDPPMPNNGTMNNWSSQFSNFGCDDSNQKPS